MHGAQLIETGGGEWIRPNRSWLLDSGQDRQYGHSQSNLTNALGFTPKNFESLKSENSAVSP